MDRSTERDCLLPKGAFWFYIIAPPVLVLLLDYQSFDRTWEFLARKYVVHLVGVLAFGGALHVLYLTATPWALARVHHVGTRLLVHLGTLAAAMVLGLPLCLAVLHVVRPITFHSVSVSRLLFSAGVLGIVIVLVVAAHTRLRQDIRKQALEAQAAKQAALKAQLSALQSRVNPHFLFNALNTVACLIPEDPEQAEATVLRLSTIFRYTLDGSRRSWVSLREEIEAVRDYLAMEAIRFGDRLSFEIDIADPLLDAPVPPLCLMPVVENAVQHGLAGRREGGHIWIHGQADADGIRLWVDDDGPGPGESSHRGSGTSMADLETRLSVLYANDSPLVLSPRPEGGSRMCLNLTVPNFTGSTFGAADLGPRADLS